MRRFRIITRTMTIAHSFQSITALLSQILEDQPSVNTSPAPRFTRYSTSIGFKLRRSYIAFSAGRDLETCNAAASYCTGTCKGSLQQLRSQREKARRTVLKPLLLTR